MRGQNIHGDNLEILKGMPADSVDLILGSPPYEKARTYGINFKLTGQDWVDWMRVRMVEMVRVSRGLVAMVLEGQTEDFRWSATPALLMADLHRAGIHLRKPPIFHRIGVPGSGGPDWLRNDYEFIVCCTSGGKLPWSDNTAMGHPPKWAPGGEMSNRTSDGSRVNQWGHSGRESQRNAEGELIQKHATTLPPVKANGRDKWGGTGHASSGEGRKANGQHKTRKSKVPGVGRIITPGGERGRDGEEQAYLPPVLANPGNTIQRRYTADEVASILAEAGEVTHHLVGGGVMGDKLCHDNEAPYPESLAEFFIRSFCPEGGTVLDPFSGSGTTGAVAERWGRNWIAIDVRESQVALTKKRIKRAERPLLGA